MSLNSGTSILSIPRLSSRFDADSMGVGLSIFCAIHCVATPFLLLLLPSFGKVWAHPASHGLVAIFVVPLAVLGFLRATGQRNRRWILICGVTGLVLVLWGAAAPFLVAEPSPGTPPSAEIVDSNTEFVFHVNDQPDAGSGIATCSSECCPLLLIGEDGKKQLHIPLASVLTTLGGIALIAAHAGNLVCCSSRGRNSSSSEKQQLLCRNIH